MFVKKPLLWPLNYMQYEQAFAYNYIRSVTLILLKMYCKPRGDIISQSVLVLIITQFFLVLPASSALYQY